MAEGQPAAVSALRASLLALGAAELDALDGTRSDGELERARQLFDAHTGGFGLVLLDDHDPHVAPGLHVGSAPEPLTPTRVRALLRSWEAFDRAFEACPMEQEQALFDARIAPCFEALGVPLSRLELARDHLFLIDLRYVASFPEERWAAHAARRASESAVSPDHERLLLGLRRLCAAPRALS